MLDGSQRSRREPLVSYTVTVLGRPAAWDSEFRAGDQVAHVGDPNEAHEWLLALYRRGYNVEARRVLHD